MKVVILSIRNEPDFSLICQKIEYKFSDSISIFPSNVTDKKTLVTVLSDQSASDDVIVEYDTDFVSELKTDLGDNTPIKFFLWNGQFSTLFDQIGDEKPEENDENNLNQLVNKFSQPIPTLTTKPINYRPQTVTTPVKKTIKTVIRIIGNGGVGKTLISLNLANFLTQSGKSALVVGDQFTILYAKDRVRVSLVNNEPTSTSLSLYPADFLIFDGIDGEDAENDDVVSQKWLIVKNKVEYDHYFDHYDHLIFNDSDGFLKKPLQFVEKDYFLPFSEVIFKNYQQKEELPLNPVLFQHFYVVFTICNKNDKQK